MLISTRSGHCRVTSTSLTTASDPTRDSAASRSTRTSGSPSSMAARSRISSAETVWAPLTSTVSTASQDENQTA